MQNITEILCDLVEGFEFNLDILSIDGDKYYLCSTEHLTIKKIIKDDLGNEFRITEIGEDYIVFEPYQHSETFQGDVVIGNSPIFLHGSPSSTNNEYLQLNTRTRNKTPFIWLLEPYTENFGANDSSFTSYSLRFFFLDWAMVEVWKNKDHNKYNVKPMRNLVDFFLKEIEKDYRFKRVNTYSVKPRVRFGVELVDSGDDNKIIDEDLSGVELSLTLDVYNINICKC